MWDFFGGMFSSALQWLAGAFDGIVDRLLGGLEGLGTWLSQAFGSFFQAITGFVGRLLQPVIWVVQGVLYLMGRVIDLAALLLRIILLLIQILFSAAHGVLTTVSNLAAWDPNTVQPTTQSVFARGIGLVFDKVNAAGFDVLAQVLAWAIWLLALLAIARIIGKRGAA